MNSSVIQIEKSASPPGAERCSGLLDHHTTRPLKFGALQRLADKAVAQHFIAEDKAKFGPCVTDPEKIVCIGLNYLDREAGRPDVYPDLRFRKGLDAGVAAEADAGGKSFRSAPDARRQGRHRRRALHRRSHLRPGR
jgi:hypothetical protein